MIKMINEVKEIFNCRSLIFMFSIMDLKLRYRQSILGIGWSFLEPLLLLSILNLVFSTILKSPVENFPIFLILNLTLYNFFSRGTSISTESILGRAGIIKSVYIKKEVFPISANITAFLMMFIEFTIVVIFFIVFQVVPPITILYLPLIVVLLAVFTLGISLPLSILNVRFRDVRVIWTVILQAMFFLTPIFYKIDFLPHPISDVARLNPVALLIEIGHNLALFGMMPNFVDLVYVIIVSFATLLIGWIIFRKLDRVTDDLL
jgi:lipopolysaccharide transport system permease protein